MTLFNSWMAELGFRVGLSDVEIDVISEKLHYPWNSYVCCVRFFRAAHIVYLPNLDGFV